MAATKKKIRARVCLPSGQYLATWTDFTFGGFTKELNAGPGECVLTLARPFDYDKNDVAEGNDVEIIVSDADTTDSFGDSDNFSARTVYRGYISLVERNLNGADESIKITLLGYYTRLALDILKSASQTTLYSHATSGLTTTSASQGAADIGLMMRTVIDRYQAETGDLRIFYIKTDIPDTGTTATFSFEQKTYRNAIDDLKQLSPADVYWYVDETGRVSFKTKPAKPTHRFVFGKHFIDVDVTRSLETVRNVLLLWNGDTSSPIYKHYEDAASIALYGRRTAAFNNYGVDDANAADLIGAKFLAENSVPETKVVCEIADNNGGEEGYDIETIQPGDTCSFVGFSSGLADIFRDNMLITKVTYALDKVQVEVEIVKSTLVDFQTRNSRQIADISNGGLGVPATYS
jgi:hypothetical protein